MCLFNELPLDSEGTSPACVFGPVSWDYSITKSQPGSLNRVPVNSQSASNHFPVSFPPTLPALPSYCWAASHLPSAPLHFGSFLFFRSQLKCHCPEKPSLAAVSIYSRLRVLEAVCAVVHSADPATSLPGLEIMSEEHMALDKSLSLSVPLAACIVKQE